jgi:hypothetical protein
MRIPILHSNLTRVRGPETLYRSRSLRATVAASCRPSIREGSSGRSNTTHSLTVGATTEAAMVPRRFDGATR